MVMPALAVLRYEARAGASLWGVRGSDGIHPLPVGLSELCQIGRERAREVIESALNREVISGRSRILAPVDDGQEVWAAGVTYLRSRDARLEESGDDLYARVYESERPELFFKALPSRVRGSGEPVGIRADAVWSVPEPELAVLFDSAGAVLGFTVGNDMSSRDIEGANALYLPQAKLYTGSCALGPAIVPAWLFADDHVFAISLTISRVGSCVFQSATTTADLRRHWVELGSWLMRGLDFPSGAVLLTGTGVVPDATVSLMAGDEIEVTIEGLGTLSNRVEVVGSGSPTADSKSRELAEA